MGSRVRDGYSLNARLFVLIAAVFLLLLPIPTAPASAANPSAFTADAFHTSSSPESAGLGATRTLNARAAALSQSQSRLAVDRSTILISDQTFVSSPPRSLKQVSVFLGKVHAGLERQKLRDQAGRFVALDSYLAELAEVKSVSPAVMLTLSELKWSLLSRPRVLDEYSVPSEEAFAEWAGVTAGVLSDAFYAYYNGNPSSVFLTADGEKMPAAGGNASSYALARYFSADLTSDAVDKQGLENSMARFAAAFEKFFGDPLAGTIQARHPSLTEIAALPTLLLPWPSGEVWYYTGGPHNFDGSGNYPLSGIDYQPAGHSGCDPQVITDHWDVASASGRTVDYQENWLKLDHDQDGNVNTGWLTVYGHIANRIGDGVAVQTGQRLGNPSCYGGVATGVHIHFGIKFENVWQPIAGVTLSGWAIVDGQVAYHGYMTKSGQTQRESCYRPGGGSDCTYAAVTSDNSGGGGTDTTPPDGDITAPSEGATITNGKVTLSGWASDAGSGLNRAHFTASSPSWHQVGSDFYSSPFSYEWDLCASGVPDGQITIGLDMWDNQGNQGNSPRGVRHITKSGGCLQPPSAPALSSPSNGSSQPYSYDLGFQWNSSANATEYLVEWWGGPYSTMQPCGWNSSTSCHIGTVLAGNTYYWHVKARNNAGESGWSESWSFTIQSQPQPPSAPALSSPGNGSGNPYNYDLAFQWNSSSGATEYLVEWWGGPYSTMQPCGWTTGTYCHIGQVAPGNTYYWHAKARNGAGESSWSDTWSFNIASTTQPPSAPALGSPGNGSGNPSNYDLTFQWNSSSGATEYLIEWWGGPYSAMQPCAWTTGTSCHIGQVTPGNTYSWHVKARNSAGESSWSDTWTFSIAATTQPPPVPVLNSPNNNSSHSYNYDLTFQWNASPGASDYFVEWWGGPYSTMQPCSWTTGTSCHIGQVAPGNTYYWHVKARNTAGESAWSDTWAFSTEATTQAPPAPVHAAPAGGSVQACGSDLTLTWLAAAGATEYWAEWWSGTSGILGSCSWAAGTSCHIGQLASGASYSWHVKARNGVGESAWSNPWTFTLQACLSGQVDLQGRGSRGDTRWKGLPLTVSLNSGSCTNAVASFTTSTDLNGAFTLTQAAPGTYYVRVKNAHTLSSCRPSVSTPTSAAVYLGTLLEGDANGDDCVLGADFSLLRTYYAKCQADPGWDARADFNGDGCILGADFSLLRTNYTRCGPVLVATSQLQGAQEPATQRSIALALTPVRRTAVVGQQVAFDILVSAGAQPVDVFDVSVTFDPRYLEPIDAQGRRAGEVEPGTSLPTVLRNSIDLNAGRVAYSAGVLTGAPPAGDFALATMRFRLVRPVPPGTRILLNATGAAFHQGISLLDTSKVSAEVFLPGAYLPLISR